MLRPSHPSTPAHRHDAVLLALRPSPQCHLHMRLVFCIGVVVWPLGELLGDDVLVERDQAGLHLQEGQAQTGGDTRAWAGPR